MTWRMTYETEKLTDLEFTLCKRIEKNNKMAAKMCLTKAALLNKV